MALDSTIGIKTHFPIVMLWFVFPFFREFMWVLDAPFLWSRIMVWLVCVGRSLFLEPWQLMLICRIGPPTVTREAAVPALGLGGPAAWRDLQRWKERRGKESI